MIIGYWSERPGKGAVTYNMVACGLGLSAISEKKVVLMQGKKDMNMLDYAFAPFVSENVIREDYGYYNYGGMETLMGKIENGRNNANLFETEGKRVMDSNLYYLPSVRIGSTQGGGNTFEKRFKNSFEKYLNVAKDSDDIVLVELSNGFEYVSQEMLDELDVLVINISQDNKPFESIRDNTALIEKAVFLIGKYDVESQFNKKEICRKYGIPEDRVGLVPYNIRYKDSFNNGTLKLFFDRHFESDGDDEEFEFMEHIKNNLKMLERAGKLNRHNLKSVGGLA